MGTKNSKLKSSPFQRLQHSKYLKAQSMSYGTGEISAFYIACDCGNIDYIREILNADNALPIAELNKLQPNGNTALHVASSNNHLEIVQLLLHHNCPRTTLNQSGNTAYEEAKTTEMRNLFHRYNSINRFHEVNIINTVALYLPQNHINKININRTGDYIHVFKSDADILNYTINQQTMAMWVRFYNWFAKRFPTLLQRDELHFETFDLLYHPDFKQFLKENLSESNHDKVMESIHEAHQQCSIEPLINLYTKENPGFYHILNELLAQPSFNTNISSHLCDRFIIEFHIHVHQLKRRRFIGKTYRGASISSNDLDIYIQLSESKPPGVLSLRTFTSTSRDRSIALTFALRTSSDDEKKHVLFIFEITEPSPTIFAIDDVSDYGHEKEVLILPGDIFIVTKVTEQQYPPITNIYLKHRNTSVSFWTKIKHTIRAGRKSVLNRTDQH